MLKHPKHKALRLKPLKHKALQQAPLKRPATAMNPQSRQHKLGKVMLRKPASPPKAAAPASAKHNAPSPLRRRGRGTRWQELRGLELRDVPMSALSCGDTGELGTASPVAGRPRRHRFQVLNAWRNERVVYERVEGSRAPSVAALRLNCAPRPPNVMPRSIDSDAFAAPKIPLLALESNLLPLMDVQPLAQSSEANPSQPPGAEAQSKQAKPVDRPEVQSTFITLPCALPGCPAQTMALPLGAEGVIYVLSGTVHLRIAVPGRKTALPTYVLKAGDTAKFPGATRQLLAETGVDTDLARIFYVLAKPNATSMKLRGDSLALQNV